ncbi:unnamed protein product, partial [Meganyctiphanes norvegica]
MYDEHPDPESTIVYPKDSVDVRILDAMAKTLNFTYFSRRPYDNEWGRIKSDGNFSGIIGELEWHNADFSLVTGPTPTRVLVTDWSCWYTFEPIMIIAKKPGLAPKAASIIRPFDNTSWMAIIATTVLMGWMIWALQKLFVTFSGRGNVQSLQDSMFVAWGTLLEDIPPQNQQPTNASAQ